LEKERERERERERGREKERSITEPRSEIRALQRGKGGRPSFVIVNNRDSLRDNAHESFSLMRIVFAIWERRLASS